MKKGFDVDFDQQTHACAYVFASSEMIKNAWKSSKVYNHMLNAV